MGNNFFTKYLQIGERLVCHLEIHSLDGNSSQRNWLQQHQLKEIEELLYEPIKARLVDVTRKEIQSQNILTGTTIRLGYVFKKKSENHTIILPSVQRNGNEDLSSNSYSVYREKIVVFVSSLVQPQTVNKLLKAIYDCSQSQTSSVSISNYFTKPGSNHGNTGENVNFGDPGSGPHEGDQVYTGNARDVDLRSYQDGRDVSEVPQDQGMRRKDRGAEQNRKRMATIKNIVEKTNKAFSKAKKEKRIAMVVKNMKEIEVNNENKEEPSTSYTDHATMNRDIVRGPECDRGAAINRDIVRGPECDRGAAINCDIVRGPECDRDVSMNRFIVRGPECDAVVPKYHSNVDYIDVQLNNEVSGNHCSKHSTNSALMIDLNMTFNTRLPSDLTTDLPNVNNMDNLHVSSNPNVRYDDELKYGPEKSSISSSEETLLLPVDFPSEVDADGQLLCMEVPSLPCEIDADSQVICTEVPLLPSEIDIDSSFSSDIISTLPGVEAHSEVLTEQVSAQPSGVDIDSQYGESSDSDLPDYEFIVARRRTSLLQKALDFCENLKCDYDDSIKPTDRKRSKHVLPNFSPSTSDEEVDPPKSSENPNTVDDNMNDIDQCYVVEKSEMDHNIEYVSNVSELGPDQLRYLVNKNKKYLKSIFQGRAESRRHVDFKKGGRSRKLLNHHVHLGLFTEEQQDVVMETLMSIFCKKHHKYLEYVMKVLLPEMLIRIQSEVHQVSHHQSEKMMMDALSKPGAVFL